MTVVAYPKIIAEIEHRPNRGWTYEEWIQLPDTPEYYEIIEGELYLPPAPGTGHQRKSKRLLRCLDDHVEERKLGEVLYAPCDVLLPDGGSAQPDLIFVSKERSDIIKEKNIQGAPDLVVEIVSPSARSRDRVLKMRAYAELGVPYYWILDPVEEALEEYELREGVYERVYAARGEETFTSRLFPGLEISLKSVWG